MFSYKKVGGIHFVQVWRFGFNFYFSKKIKTAIAAKKVDAQLDLAL
jgi:hypothetical protein